MMCQKTEIIRHFVTINIDSLDLLLNSRMPVCPVGSEESFEGNGSLLGVARDYQPAGSPGLQVPLPPSMRLSSSPPVHIAYKGK